MDIKKDNMVNGMPRCIVDFQTATGDVQYVSFIDDMQAFPWHRLDITPELLHAISIDTRRAIDKFGGIKQVWRAFTMNIHLRFRHVVKQCARCSSMIEVDVRCQNMSYILGINTRLL